MYIIHITVICDIDQYEWMKSNVYTHNCFYKCVTERMYLWYTNTYTNKQWASLWKFHIESRVRHQGSVGEQHDQDSSVSHDATRRDLWIFSVEKRISFLAAVTLEDEGRYLTIPLNVNLPPTFYATNYCVLPIFDCCCQTPGFDAEAKTFAIWSDVDPFYTDICDGAASWLSGCWAGPKLQVEKIP